MVGQLGHGWIAGLWLDSLVMVVQLGHGWIAWSWWDSWAMEG